MLVSRLVKSICVSAAALAISFAISPPNPASAGIIFSIAVAPPPLPVYVQPYAPGPEYIWSPGYWAYDDVDGYFWVPGTWVRAPQVGLLWTPGYWGWRDGFYVWNAGYWGPHVGFYGGINYGCGYTGSGYWGGHWDHGSFFYNTSVTRVNTTIIHNTYNTVVINNNVQRVSFNGGNGGITAKPSQTELSVQHEHHFGPTTAQAQQQHVASTNKSLFASVNHGAPKIAATSKAGVFTGHGIVGAKNAKSSSPGSLPVKNANSHLTGKGLHMAATGQSADTHLNTYAQHAPKNFSGVGQTQSKPHSPQMSAKHLPQNKPPKMVAAHRSPPHRANGGHPQGGKKRPEHG